MHFAFGLIAVFVEMPEAPPAFGRRVTNGFSFVMSVSVALGKSDVTRLFLTLRAAFFSVALCAQALGHSDTSPHLLKLIWSH